MKGHQKSVLYSGKMWVAVALVIYLGYGCSSGQSDSHATATGDSKSTTNDEIVAPKNPDGYSGVVGDVAKFSDTEVEITVDSKPLVIKLTDSVHIYAPTTSSLANVQLSAYIGVLSKKQADQSEKAVRVFILPEELRGANEGSFMLPADTEAESDSRMTNGSASRMSNGSVSGADGTSLTLQFLGHSRTENIPPNTPVVEYKLLGRKPAPGDKIFALVKKDDHGNSETSRIVIF